MKRSGGPLDYLYNSQRYKKAESYNKNYLKPISSDMPKDLSTLIFSYNFNYNDFQSCLRVSKSWCVFVKNEINRREGVLFNTIIRKIHLIFPPEFFPKPKIDCPHPLSVEQTKKEVLCDEDMQEPKPEQTAEQKKFLNFLLTHEKYKEVFQNSWKKIEARPETQQIQPIFKTHCLLKEELINIFENLFRLIDNPTASDLYFLSLFLSQHPDRDVLKISGGQNGYRNYILLLCRR